MKSRADVGHLVRTMTRSRSFAAVLARLAASEPVVVGNLVGSSAALLLAALAEYRPRRIVVITSTIGEAQGLGDDLGSLSPDVPTRYLPTVDEGGFLAEAQSAFGQRLDVAAELASGEPVLLVASIPALFDPLPSGARLAQATLTVAVGEEHDRDRIGERLGEAGFERVALVESHGQFAVRGGIIDVFDHASRHPYRIELFGDHVDSIRAFDHASQRSIEPRDRVALSLLAPEALAGAEDGVAVARVLDLIDDSVLLVERDPDHVEQAVERHLERTGAARDRELIDALATRTRLRLSRLPAGEAGVDFDIGAVEARGSDVRAAAETLDVLTRDGGDVTVCFAAEGERRRFEEALGEECEPLLVESLRARPIHGLAGSFYRGFRWPAERLALVNHRELFDVVFHRRPTRVRMEPQSRAIDDFVDLSVGDYVVHIANGIARFLGIETIEKGGETQEFFTLEFRDEVRLYVPVAKADLVQKYIGGKGEAPQLSRLGGRSWSRKKEEVYRAVADLAVEMLETQAVRAREEGFACPPDTPWQHEFEAAFPFEETPDQLGAIEAIRADLESPKPMDRLLCGDVGYGKTEVAMRAAFKIVSSGRQVAVLVPTTVLAEQHLMTFRERMAGYPVEVAGLSRFRSKKEQTEALVGLVEGSVDIVIGTHRLLSKDVTFKDLGLVIIDEEQRFGVAHKEKLRSIRRTVDVLVLTATPIPRTLHLSLLGIRDISSLTQPPSGRQPVETRIVPFADAVVRDAILLELERGGQCFFVHNRVQSIDRVRRDLVRIVPKARILVIHGQQKEREIEENLFAFVRHEADILLATTIIESGLDIPNANTIFIDRPDMYGLADLHQLRGRVGRQREKAHAYLLLRPDVIIAGDAEKRLRAIEEFNELGSGFRIAMRDLEIRGAGNLLGHEQHGHIAAVGYDMYCRLLDAAVKHLKKERAILPDEVDLNLDFEAFIPSTWISEAKVKLEVYRKLGRAQRESDFEEVVEELRDRFGPLPPKAVEFVDVCRIRALAEHLRLKRVATSAGHGLYVRPQEMKALRRRLVATGAEGRIIGGKDVLLPHPSVFGSPAEVLALLRRALVPGGAPH